MSQVKVAILGCGGMAGEHARRLKGNTDAQIVALCDVSEEVVNKFIERTCPITNLARKFSLTAPRCTSRPSPTA